MPNISAKNILTILLVFCPVVVYYLIFQKYALNIPHWDDFAVRNTLVYMIETESFSEKIKFLLSQHNEHRILSTRVLAWIIYVLQGTLNLKSLMLIGFAALVGILFLFFQVLKKYNSFKLASLVPISFILFNVGLFENTFWGMAAVPNFGVIFFAFLTFYWLVFSIENKHKYYFYFALFLCFIGVFTSSNGIIIPFTGCLILLFQQRRKQLITWLGSSFVFIFIFFFNYQKSPANVISTNLFELSTLIKGFLATFGSVLDSSVVAPNKHLDFAIAFGLVLLIIISAFTCQVLLNKNKLTHHRTTTSDLYLLSCLVFIGVTILGIVVARISFGIETLISSKYKIYSVLSFIISYSIILNLLADRYKNNFIRLAIFISILFNFYTFIADFTDIKYLNQGRITEQFTQQHTEKSYPRYGLMRVLQRPEKVFYDSIIPEIRQRKESTSQYLKVVPNSEYIVLQKTGQKLDLTNPESGLYFILKSDKNIYLYPSYIKPLSIKSYLGSDFLVKNLLRVDNFTAYVSKSHIQSGKYLVGMVLVENENKTISWSREVIDIQQVKKEIPIKNW